MPSRSGATEAVPGWVSPFLQITHFVVPPPETFLQLVLVWLIRCDDDGFLIQDGVRDNSRAHRANFGRNSYSQRDRPAPHELALGTGCLSNLWGVVLAREFLLKLIQGRQQGRDRLSEAM